MPAAEHEGYSRQLPRSLHHCGPKVENVHVIKMKFIKIKNIMPTRTSLTGGCGSGRRSSDTRRSRPAASATVTFTLEPAGPRSSAVTSSFVSPVPSTW